MRIPTAKTVLIGLSLATLLASCQSPAAPSARQTPTTATLQIVNDYRAPIFVFYSACESNAWGGDRLGAAVIAAGASQSLTMSPGCWDVKLVAADNTTWMNRGENLAAGILLTLTAS